VLRSAFSEDESFIEIDLVNKLQSIVEKQRDQIRTLDTSLADIKSELDEVTATMRSSLVVRAYDCQCTSCNGPGFGPSISRHSGI
jgi:hypothetical protein